MSKFGVRADKEAALQARMRKLSIREEDLEERFIRSSGPGGQNVNKTATCVYLKHLPTGIEVKVQQERSQAINRFLARRILADRLEERIHGVRSAQQEARERIRRQKSRRRRRGSTRIPDSHFSGKFGKSENRNPKPETNSTDPKTKD